MTTPSPRLDGPTPGPVVEGLPDSLTGHWDTTGDREMAERYLKEGRHQLAKGDLSDMALANAQYLEDINVGTVTFQSAIAMQTAAKERIRWLSAHLALANANSRDMLDALTKLRKALDLVDPSRPLQYADAMDLMRKCANAAIMRKKRKDDTDRAQAKRDAAKAAATKPKSTFTKPIPEPVAVKKGAR
jgi:hypothetical protein